MQALDQLLKWIDYAYVANALKSRVIGPQLITNIKYEAGDRYGTQRQKGGYSGRKLV